MIAVIGEALIDLVANSDGRFAARPGGAGFNTARAIGRLGVTPAFLDRLSGDGFGRLLRSTLDSDGVKLAVPEPADVPTTLALVDIDRDQPIGNGELGQRQPHLVAVARIEIVVETQHGVP